MIKLQASAILALGVGMFGAGAQAASIVNLSDRQQRIVIEVLGQYSEATLAPGQRWLTSKYPVEIELNGATTRLEVDGDYAIWNDGSLALQRRSRVGDTQK